MKKIFKKSISILLAVVMVLSIAPLNGFVGLDLPEFRGFKKISDSVSDFFDGFAIKAEAVTYSGTCGENLTWELDTGTGELVISGEGYMYGWSWISGPTWSEYDDKIKKVVINEGVRNIGSFAFDSCSNMEEIYIPASAYIDSFVFGGCSSLKRIDVSKGNNHYSSDESGVLFNKAQTSIIMYPAGKESTHFTIPDKVKRIESDAFENCVNLTTVGFGTNSQLTHISLGAFSGCNRLEIIENIPDSLTYIGQSVFSNCTALTSITLPPCLTSVDSSTFYKCISLVEIEIPDSVSVIGENAFAYCEKLSKINIPEGVTTIGESAFHCCYSLNAVVIPETVISIGKSAFENCDSLTSIIIPEGITTIGESAFSSCSYLTAVSLSDNLTDIEDNAFDGCCVLDDVYYAGTEKEWDKINIGENNEALIESIFNYNYKEGVSLNGFKYHQVHTVNNYVNNNSNYKKTYFNGMAVPLDGTNGTPNMCIPGLSEDDDMVPQGITCYEDIKGRKWILVSAYSSKGSKIKDRASVIYALDFNTGEYVAEFTIYNFDKTPHTGHVGGIAASEGCLYIADSDSKISYISLDKLDVKEGTSKSIIIEGSYDFSSYLNDAKVSYLSYSDDYLWLGNFYHTIPEFNTPASKTHNSLILGYKVTNFRGGDDNLKDENAEYNGESEDGVFKAKKPHFTFEIPNSVSKIQGVAVSFNYPHEVILMCSYGRGVASDVYSFSFKYDNFIGSDPNWVYTVDESSIKSLKGIPMLEGAFEYKDNIYMISESAAYYYNGYYSNNKSKDPTDVVWRIQHNHYIAPDETPFEDIYNLGEETYSFQNFIDSDSNGHCFGMSVTSAGYHTGILDIGVIGGNSKTDLYSLDATEKVKKPICYYQNKQGSCFMNSIVAGGRNYRYINFMMGIADPEADWNEVVNYVKNHQYDNRGDLQICFRKKFEGGHAVNFLRYAVVDGQDRIYIYDNNYPTTETYLYKNSKGEILQAPKQTFSGAIDCVALCDISKYFSNVKNFKALCAIYAYNDAIKIEGVSVYPMNCGAEAGEWVVFEVPDNVNEITIKPLKDNACFRYLDKEYSFGDTDKNTVGILKLTTEEDESSQVVEFSVIEKSEISINEPSTATISYGDSIILHTDIAGTVPEGAKIIWSQNNDNFEIVGISSDCVTCKITPKSSGDTTFTAKVVSSDGEVLAEDTQTMTSKAGLWDKIVAFFKKIFGLTKTIPQIYRGVF